MSTKTIKIVRCDKCGISIAEKTKYINANTYGRDFCVNCFINMNALDLVKILNLDEIKLMYINDWENSAKICYMDNWMIR